MKAELVKRQDRWDLYGEDGSKIASSAPNPVGKLSIKNCEAIANGYDLEELLDGLLINRGEHFSRVRNPLYGEERQLAKDLAQKTLELLGDKKFSEFLDREKELGISDKKTIERIQWYYNTYFDKSKQNEWEVEILTEPAEQSGDNVWHNAKLDAEGCLILKRIER